MKVRWTKRGEVERDEQLDFYAERSVRVAHRMDGEVRRQVALLEDHPRMGRPQPGTGQRELVISRTPFVVIYRLTETEILIERLHHGRSDWRRSS